MSKHRDGRFLTRSISFLWSGSVRNEHEHVPGGSNAFLRFCAERFLASSHIQRMGSTCVHV